MEGCLKQRELFRVSGPIAIVIEACSVRYLNLKSWGIIQLPRNDKQGLEGLYDANLTSYCVELRGESRRLSRTLGQASGEARATPQQSLPFQHIKLCDFHCQSKIVWANGGFRRTLEEY